MKRLIEEYFPVEQVSASCKREKSIRQGHISTLQTWWARRPLAVCRAAIFLASLPERKILLRNKKLKIILEGLYPGVGSTESQLHRLVVEMADFSNSNNEALISAAREIISLVNKNPSLADTFSGGGSIPIEASRLGLKTYASDLNPIAAIGLKLSLSYAPGMTKEALKRFEGDIEAISEELKSADKNAIPDQEDLAYFWFKTYICPHCKLTTPLYQNKWLSKTGTKTAIKINADRKKGILKLGVYEPTCEAEYEAADAGTVSSKSACCIFCGEATATEEIMRQGIAGNLGEVQYATLRLVDGKRIYTATPNPLNIQELKNVVKIKKSKKDFVDLDLALDLNGVRHLWAIQYGIKKVSDLFNPRQYAAIQNMAESIQRRKKIIESSSSSEDERMFRILSLLMIMNKVAIYSNRHSWWQSNGAFPANIFVRQAISMVWNYVEIPPTSLGAGGWLSSSRWIVKALQHLMLVKGSAIVNQSDAASTTIPSQSLDLVVIDPPYFDSITYAYLSDFFYPWTRKLLDSEFPEWFVANTTPKAQELIVDRKHKLAPSPKSGDFFTEKMTDCLVEARRTLSKEGVLVLMYGHKELVAWEALFKSIKNANLRVAVSWPIQTERKSKFQHSRVDALGISCLLILKQLPLGFDADPIIAPDKFKDMAASKLSQLKEIHPELLNDPVALSMAVFPLVLDHYMHCKVLDENGESVPVKDLLDCLNL